MWCGNKIHVNFFFFFTFQHFTKKPLNVWSQLNYISSYVIPIITPISLLYITPITDYIDYNSSSLTGMEQ